MIKTTKIQLRQLKNGSWKNAKKFRVLEGADLTGADLTGVKGTKKIIIKKKKILLQKDMKKEN